MLGRVFAGQHLLLLSLGRAPIIRASWSSHHAIRRMVIWQPMQRWCCRRKHRQETARAGQKVSQTKLRADDNVASVNIAGPGFINLTLKSHVWGEELRLALAQRAATTAAAVSAKVKGSISSSSRRIRPGRCMLAIAEGRWSAMRWPRSCPMRVSPSRAKLHQRCRRAGRCLGRSAFMRYREALGETVSIPEGLYPGDYLVPVGAGSPNLWAQPPR